MKNLLVSILLFSNSTLSMASKLVPADSIKYYLWGHKDFQAQARLNLNFSDSSFVFFLFEDLSGLPLKGLFMADSASLQLNFIENCEERLYTRHPILFRESIDGSISDMTISIFSTVPDSLFVLQNYYVKKIVSPNPATGKSETIGVTLYYKDNVVENHYLRDKKTNVLHIIIPFNFNQITGTESVMNLKVLNGNELELNGFIFKEIFLNTPEKGRKRKMFCRKR